MVRSFRQMRYPAGKLYRKPPPHIRRRKIEIDHVLPTKKASLAPSHRLAASRSTDPETTARNTDHFKLHDGKSVVHVSIFR